MITIMAHPITAWDVPSIPSGATFAVPDICQFFLNMMPIDSSTRFRA